MMNILLMTDDILLKLGAQAKVTFFNCCLASVRFRARDFSLMRALWRWRKSLCLAAGEGDVKNGGTEGEAWVG